MEAVALADRVLMIEHGRIDVNVDARVRPGGARQYVAIDQNEDGLPAPRALRQ